MKCQMGHTIGAQRGQRPHRSPLYGPLPLTDLVSYVEAGGHLMGPHRLCLLQYVP